MREEIRRTVLICCVFLVGILIGLVFCRFHNWFFPCYEKMCCASERDRYSYLDTSIQQLGVGSDFDAGMPDLNTKIHTREPNEAQDPKYIDILKKYVKSRLGNDGSSTAGGASNGGVSQGGSSNGSPSAGSTSNGGGSSATAGSTLGSTSNGGASQGGSSNGSTSLGTTSNGGSSSPTVGGSAGSTSNGGVSQGGSSNGSPSAGTTSNGGSGSPTTVGGTTNGGATQGGTSNGSTSLGSTTNGGTSSPPPSHCINPLGGTIAHGSNKVFFQSSSVQYPDTCQSEPRICTNGKLSGSFTASSCSQIARSCSTEQRGVVQHNQTVTAYSKSNLEYGDFCDDYKSSRICIDGTLQGGSNYIFASCTSKPGLSCSGPDGRNYTHDEIATYYLFQFVKGVKATGVDLCPREARICKNGIWVEPTTMIKSAFQYTYPFCKAEILSD